MRELALLENVEEERHLVEKWREGNQVVAIFDKPVHIVRCKPRLLLESRRQETVILAFAEVLDCKIPADRPILAPVGALVAEVVERNESKIQDQAGLFRIVDLKDVRLLHQSQTTCEMLTGRNSNYLFDLRPKRAVPTRQLVR